MRDYTLEQLFDLQMGKTPARDESSYWSDGIHDWISIRDLTNSDKYINVTNEKISDIAVKKTGIRLIPQNTVIMSFKLSIGKVAITSKDMYSNEAIMAFHDKKVTEIIPEYLYYLLLGHKWDEGSNKAVMGITLNKATLSKIIISIHETKTQNKIVTTLGLLDQIIKNKKQQLSEYDQFIKSRFVEMFGEVEFNTKKHDLIKYGDVFELNAGGTPSKNKPEYWKNGTISWIGSNLCQNSIIYENDGKYITEEGYKNSSARLFPIDTVLVALVGATIGKTALLKFETATNQNVLGIKGIKEAGFNPYFVYYYTQGLYNKFLNIGDGGFSMASKKFISELDIAKVNIENQNDFAKFVQQVDKLKFVVQKSLDQTQMLFDSLMQEYFG